ncbi:hypothetical protein WJX73_003930 [Symbiochloris irregularis]|uniref:Uncharacterized protein n=1 Tax=Symbiochloris irregularis TaxID=706552 RepID=A0AAW1P211_9CHLO
MWLYNVRDFVTPYNLTVAELVDDISALRNSVDGTSNDDAGIQTAQGAIELVPVNSNGLVYTRTPKQVLDVVTFGAANGAGGFFPNGVNGYFAASS